MPMFTRILTNLFYAPDFEDVGGAYYVCVVRSSVRPHDRDAFLLSEISYSLFKLGP